MITLLTVTPFSASFSALMMMPLAVLLSFLAETKNSLPPKPLYIERFHLGTPARDRKHV